MVDDPETLQEYLDQIDDSTPYALLVENDEGGADCMINEGQVPDIAESQVRLIATHMNAVADSTDVGIEEVAQVCLNAASNMREGGFSRIKFPRD